MAMDELKKKSTHLLWRSKSFVTGNERPFKIVTELTNKDGMCIQEGGIGLSVLPLETQSFICLLFIVCRI